MPKFNILCSFSPLHSRGGGGGGQNSNEPSRVAKFRKLTKFSEIWCMEPFLCVDSENGTHFCQNATVCAHLHPFIETPMGAQNSNEPSLGGLGGGGEF